LNIRSFLCSNASRAGDVVGAGGVGITEIVTSWIVAEPLPSTL
jgi:hypothetical protein